MKFKNLRNKLWVCVLVVCLLLTGIPMTAFATEAEAAEPEEFIIPEDAIYLSSPEDILNLAENCISDAWSRDKVVVLKNSCTSSSASRPPKKSSLGPLYRII